MICIRFFKTRYEAYLGKKTLEEGGIKSVVSEDTFNGVPIQAFGVQARFRLKVNDKDFNSAIIFLASRFKETRLEDSN